MKYTSHSTFTYRYAVTFMFFTMLIGTATVSLTSAHIANAAGVEVTVTGLEKNDVVTLRLMPELEGNDISPVLFEQSVQGNGQNNLSINVPISVPDGYYQLILEGSSKYFRDPKGYFFQVSQQQIVNPARHSFLFNLLLASTQPYLTCTEAQMNGEAGGETITGDLAGEELINDEPICQAERMISFSAPIRQPISNQEGPLSTGYHYFGPYAAQATKGVRGRFTVVNPAVCHSNCIGSMFALEHVYEQYYESNGTQHWMEVGWVEASWQANNRYVFQFNSTDFVWDIYSDSPLSDGTQLRVRVRHSSGNTWRAEKYSGSSWILLRSANIGFSTGQNSYNKGEVYTDDPNWHPGFPSSTFNEGYLLVDGIWKIWDTRFPTVVWRYPSDGPYDTHVTTSYTLFCIHYHSSSNCTP